MAMDGIRILGEGPSSIQPLPGLRAPAPATPAAGGASFADALGQALGQVEALQLQGDQQAALSAMGQGNLHETALALEKADVSMRLATKVRNKLVEAYQEVMRMSV
jgi:flagellar hook-basal body complex protein FliE